MRGRHSGRGGRRTLALASMLAAAITAAPASAAETRWKAPRAPQTWRWSHIRLSDTKITFANGESWALQFIGEATLSGFESPTTTKALTRTYRVVTPAEDVACGTQGVPGPVGYIAISEGHGLGYYLPHSHGPLRALSLGYYTPSHQICAYVNSLQGGTYIPEDATP